MLDLAISKPNSKFHLNVNDDKNKGKCLRAFFTLELVFDYSSLSLPSSSGVGVAPAEMVGFSCVCGIYSTADPPGNTIYRITSSSEGRFVVIVNADCCPGPRLARAGTPEDEVII